MLYEISSSLSSAHSCMTVMKRTRSRSNEGFYDLERSGMDDDYT